MAVTNFAHEVNHPGKAKEAVDTAGRSKRQGPGALYLHILKLMQTQGDLHWLGSDNERFSSHRFLQ